MVVYYGNSTALAEYRSSGQVSSSLGQLKDGTTVLAASRDGKTYVAYGLSKEPPAGDDDRLKIVLYRYNSSTKLFTDRTSNINEAFYAEAKEFPEAGLTETDITSYRKDFKCTLNANGDFLAITYRQTDKSGACVILAYDAHTLTWTTVGAPIYVPYPDKETYFSDVSIADDGMTVAVSNMTSTAHTASTSSKGAAYVFRLTQTGWSQLGSNIFGPQSFASEGAAFGYRVVLRSHRNAETTKEHLFLAVMQLEHERTTHATENELRVFVFEHVEGKNWDLRDVHNNAPAMSVQYPKTGSSIWTQDKNAGIPASMDMTDDGSHVVCSDVVTVRVWKLNANNAYQHLADLQQNNNGALITDLRVSGDGKFLTTSIFDTEETPAKSSYLTRWEEKSLPTTGYDYVGKVLFEGQLQTSFDTDRTGKYAVVHTNDGASRHITFLKDGQPVAADDPPLSHVKLGDITAPPTDLPTTPNVILEFGPDQGEYLSVPRPTSVEHTSNQTPTNGFQSLFRLDGTGDYVFVTAAGITNPTAVYVYTMPNGSNTWSEKQILIPGPHRLGPTYILRGLAVSQGSNRYTAEGFPVHRIVCTYNQGDPTNNGLLEQSEFYFDANGMVHSTSIATRGGRAPAFVSISDNGEFIAFIGKNLTTYPNDWQLFVMFNWLGAGTSLDGTSNVDINQVGIGERDYAGTIPKGLTMSGDGKYVYVAVGYHGQHSFITRYDMGMWETLGRNASVLHGAPGRFLMVSSTGDDIISVKTNGNGDVLAVGHRGSDDLGVVHVMTGLLSRDGTTDQYIIEPQRKQLIYPTDFPRGLPGEPGYSKISTFYVDQDLDLLKDEILHFPAALPTTESLYANTTYYHPITGDYKFYYGSYLDVSHNGTTVLAGGRDLAHTYHMDPADGSWSRTLSSVPTGIPSTMLLCDDFLVTSMHLSEIGIEFFTRYYNPDMARWSSEDRRVITFQAPSFTFVEAAQATIGGDPYLFPCSGPPIKLPNKYGAYRMYQNRTKGIFVDATVDQVDLTGRIGAGKLDWAKPVSKGYYITKLTIHDRGEPVVLDLGLDSEFLETEDACLKWCGEQLHEARPDKKEAMTEVLYGSYCCRTLQLSDGARLELRKYRNAQIMNGMCWTLPPRQEGLVDGLVYRNVRPKYFDVSGKKRGVRFVDLPPEPHLVTKCLVAKGEVQASVLHAELFNQLIHN